MSEVTETKPTPIPMDAHSSTVAPMPEQYDREKHFIGFKGDLASKSRNEIIRLCFDACEAINFLEARVKELEEITAQGAPEKPKEEKKSWLARKFR